MSICLGSFYVVANFKLVREVPNLRGISATHNPIDPLLKIPNLTGIRLRPDKLLVYLHIEVYPHLEVYHGYTFHTYKYQTINLKMIIRHVSSC